MLLQAWRLSRRKAATRLCEPLPRARGTAPARAASASTLVGEPPPGPSLVGSIRALLRGSLQDSAYHRQVREQYGDVVRLWAGQNFILVFDPDLYMQVLQQEWALPHGAAPETWPLVTYYKQRSADCMPMMLLQGEAWREPRHKIQKQFFGYKAADDYQMGISAVVNDVSRHLRDNPVPSDLNQFLCDASFEMLAQVLLDRRMGLLDNSSTPMERRFISSSVTAFHAVGQLMLQPPMPYALLRCSPTWRRFQASMDDVWDIGMALLEEAEATLPQEALLTKLFKEGGMGRQERLVNLVTLLQGGVDTTSNSLAWALYELARRPVEQQRLREELHRVLPPEGYQRALLPQLPYLKAFLREVHRLSPTASATLRRLPFDVKLGSYVAPKGSLLFWSGAPFSMDAGLLGGDAGAFAPERWLAAEGIPKGAEPRRPSLVGGAAAPAPVLSHPLLATPFGVGPRMCVGARVAQNEIHTLISRVCHDFRLALDPPEQEVQSVAKLVNTPVPAPRIHFEAL